MAPKRIPSRREERTVHAGYLAKAEEFLRSALDNANSRRWNAAALSAIHAGIAAADAVLVFERGLRSASQRHEDVLDLLAGKPVPDQIRSRIPQSGGIQEAAPNDLVLITFSGHGYAGDHGVFYLLPEDVGPGQGMDATPEFLTRCVSSEELAEWLRDVDAGDMAMVVDACHSAASVEGGGFKPGPMGSRGLGQLSFDKGMRILTASQANRPALESSQLEQGLLSYALVQDGLEQGKADYKPADRVIMLSEWMSYATDRVPKLYEEIIAGGVRGTELIPPEGISLLKKKGAFQQPSLFDFVKKQRDVMLVR